MRRDEFNSMLKADSVQEDIMYERIQKENKELHAEIKRKDEAIDFVIENDDQMSGSSYDILNEALIGRESKILEYYRALLAEGVDSDE